jgi:hypothetical protein
MEDRKLEESPEVMAGVAMSLAREREALRKKAEEAREAGNGGSDVLTAIGVVVVLVGTLALMLFMNKA